jgi:hypothetical protein
VYEWKRFLEGQETAEDDARSARPSTTHTAENTEQVQELLQHNRILPSECFQRSKTACHEILREELGKTKLNATAK